MEYRVNNFNALCFLFIIILFEIITASPIINARKINKLSLLICSEENFKDLKLFKILDEDLKFFVHSLVGRAKKKQTNFIVEEIGSSFSKTEKGLLSLTFQYQIVQKYTREKVYVSQNSRYKELVLYKQTHIKNKLGGKLSIKDILSKRELDVLSLICQEYSSKLIADELYISKYTVDNHRKNMLKKTGVKNVGGLVKWALEMGISELFKVVLILFLFR